MAGPPVAPCIWGRGVFEGSADDPLPVGRTPAQRRLLASVLARCLAQRTGTIALGATTPRRADGGLRRLRFFGGWLGRRGGSVRAYLFRRDEHGLVLKLHGDTRKSLMHTAAA